MTRRAAGVTTILLLARPALFACPVCFQFERSATTDGLWAAVLVLVGVTTAVLAGFGVFLVKWARRS